MGTFVIQRIIKVGVFVDHMIHERFTLRPDHPSISTECGCGTPVKMPLTRFDPLSECFASLCFGNAAKNFANFCRNKDKRCASAIKHNTR